ncbi:hypothetical protein ACIQXV_10970 [Neobacillus sp. NPDC097160]|uniref:hypothetical protein n=1 Tax=Neobacillus sp. NPDC097160 TaxID=3364298 RepID=UPI0038239CC1
MESMKKKHMDFLGSKGTTNINHNLTMTNFEVGEKVKIKRVNKESMELEDYFYLKEFENRIGTICERNACISETYAYKVKFDENEFGYFYNEDIILMNV